MTLLNYEVMYVRQVLDRRRRRQIREADHRVSTSGQRHRSRLWDQQQSRRSSRTAFRRRPHSTSVSVRTLWSSKLRRRYMQCKYKHIHRFSQNPGPVQWLWQNRGFLRVAGRHVIYRWKRLTKYYSHTYPWTLFLFTYCNTRHTRVILRFCRDCLA